MARAGVPGCEINERRVRAKSLVIIILHYKAPPWTCSHSSTVPELEPEHGLQGYVIICEPRYIGWNGRAHATCSLNESYVLADVDVPIHFGEVTLGTLSDR